MEFKQKCKICGERHRLGPCPSFAKDRLVQPVSTEDESMTGFFNGLTDEQKRRALEYVGPDVLGSKKRPSPYPALFTFAEPGICPHCDQNREIDRVQRARQVDRVKRYRERKKNGGGVPAL